MRTHSHRGAVLLSVFLAILFCRTAYAHGAPPSPLVLEGFGRATIPLDGGWQFRTGDDPAWASQGFDDSAWESIQAGRPWEAQGHYGYTGFAWYRRHLILPHGTPKDLDLALFVPAVDSAYEVYWNGILVGSIGKLPPHPVWYFGTGMPRGVFRLGPAQSGVLAIRVWKAPTVFYSFPAEGGLISVPSAGSAEAISALNDAAGYHRMRADEFTLTVARVSAIVGILAVLFFLRNPGQRVLLWLAVAMCFPVVNLLIEGVPGPVPFRVFYGLIGPAVALNDMAIWFLLIAFLGLDNRRRLVQWTKIFIIAEFSLVSVTALFQLFDWTAHYGRVFLILDIACSIPAPIELWGVVLVLAALRHRLDAARWFFAISALLSELFQAAVDITGLGQRWTHWTIAGKLTATVVTVAGSALDVHDFVSTLMLLAIIYMAWHYAVEQYQRKSALELEHRNARAVQQVLIPDEIPRVPGFAIESVYKPAGQVGGDFFQILPASRDGVLIVIGDVSGKGMPAAMTVSLLVGTVRTLAHYTQSPGEILAAMNQRMLARSEGGFTTCLIARVDLEGVLTVANAGHLAPYLGGVELAVDTGLPLGLSGESTYPESTHRIGQGQQLTLITDGVVEARTRAGELFGFDRTAALSREPAEKIARAAQGFGQEDDITVLNLKLAAAQPAPA